jgi:ribosomal protein L2
MSNVLIPRRQIERGMVVECPQRSSIGSHNATVVHNTPVGTYVPRSVVELDCGHLVNMTDAHGLFRAEEDR